MKLCSYLKDDAILCGIVTDAEIIDISSNYKGTVKINTLIDALGVL
ncbi:MAG: hypothetical protein WDA68_03050 [Phycisphaerae bacterium]